MSSIHVDIGPVGSGVVGPWRELLKRAAPNVFLDPGALEAVAAANFAQTHVLLAWNQSTIPQTLVGVWAFQEWKPAPLWPSVLAAPPYEYAFGSSPVVDPAHTDAVIAAFFDAIERSRSLPKVIRLKYLDGESETYTAIMQALAERRSRILKLSSQARPFLSADFGLKRSGSTRKKLRQDWNRLCAQGAAEIVNDRAHEAIRDAFETFLTMEAAGWKGSRRTALLSNSKDAAFVRRFIDNLAAQRNASVALLRLDDQAIAAQVLLYCGRTAYTWKTAFDERFAKHSPGAVLVDKAADLLLSTGEVDVIDSCSPEGSFMGQIWAGRRTIVDLLADIRSGHSLGFAAAAIAENGYAQLRGLRDKLRTAASLMAKPARSLSALAKPPR